MAQELLHEQKIKQKQSFLQEETIEINEKTIRRPFQVSMPNSSSDFKVICDVLEPAFITEEMTDHEGKEFVGAIVYKINEHDTIRRDFVKNLGQTSLDRQKLGYRMMSLIDKTKLKLIDPHTEFLRTGNRGNIQGFIKLKPPEYLKSYLQARKEISKNDKDKEAKFEVIHNQFWENLFASTGESGRKRVLNFISWFRERAVTDMGSDKFLPPVPLIKYSDSRLRMIAITRDINKDAFELYGDQTAFYLVMEASIFRDSAAIQQIAEIISASKSPVIALKILGIKRMTETGFGEFAKKNFEYFLKIINDVKQLQPNKLVGLLDGGGFGYSLIGTGIDFFTDTISNYPQDGFKRNSKGKKHRGLLHPKTLTVEPIEGVVDHQKQFGIIFHTGQIADIYKKQQVLQTSIDEWSVHARKMGLLMWQKRMWALMNTGKLEWAGIRFDEVVNSDFSVLAPIIKRVMNGE